MVFKKKNRDDLRAFITSLADLLLPRVCASCSSNLSTSENSICNNCLNKILPADQQFIEKEFIRKFKDKGLITSFNSLFIFEKDKELQEIIHSIKYRNRFLTAEFLGRLAGQSLKHEINPWTAELIIPVPLNKLRTAERGYNQSFYFAKGLSSVLKIPYYNNILRRVRYTDSQTHLSIQQREENMKSAFSIRQKNYIKNKIIILVDDVITTGATINECAKVLRNNGSGKVYAVSAAIAEKL